MATYIVFFSLLAVCFTQVHSQACPVVLPPPCAPCAPAPCPPPFTPSPCLQVINPNPQVTTIIDNSISNALVNALQLLIVSNLIGSGGPPLVGNLGPILETLVCATPCAPEIPEYIIPCPNLEIIAPCAPIPCPNFELIPPGAPCAPTPCGPKFDLLPPCGPILDYPTPFCGLSDIISPNFFTYTEPPLCIDTLPPTIFNGHEAIFPLYGIDTIAPNYYGLTEIVSPNYYPVADIPSYGFADFISEVGPNLPIPIYGGVPELSYGPLAALAPNYFGGLTEMVSQVPLAAEVVFPSTLPAQLTCNFGYTQSSLPCVRLNVEPLPYDLCNGFGSPLFY